MMMACLEEVRDAQISIDMELSPIEDSYAFLHKCGVNVAKEEVERVDSLRYSFKRLLSQAVSEANNTVHTPLPPPSSQSKVQLELVEIQPQFKTNLLESVETYRTNLSSFMNNYKTVRKNTCTNVTVL